jgi:hypothetical protein
VSEEVQGRKNSLLGELETAVRKAHANGKSAYLWSQALFICALSCSVIAVAVGLFANVSAKTVGGIAALPPLIAFIAVNLKLESRSRWHYEKEYVMDALRSRLRYQLPEEPSVDDIAAIANERDKQNARLEEKWQETNVISWVDLLKPPKKPPDDKSAGQLPSR